MFDYSRNDIKKTLKKLGLKKNDLVFCHSNVGYFGKMKNTKSKDKLCSIFFNEINKIIGSKGTFIVPTFTYSFFEKKNFTINSKSKMGIFSEWFRKKKGAIRSLDPNFSICAYGRNKHYFTTLPEKNTYSALSFFGKFHNFNGKILNLNFPGTTLIHYYEKLIDINYRFEKTFKGNVNNKKESWTVYSRYYKKGYEHNPFKIMEILRRRKKNNFARLGKGEIFLIESKILFKLIRKELRKDKNLLIEKL